jgi:hypothetical protein
MDVSRTAYFLKIADGSGAMKQADTGPFLWEKEISRVVYRQLHELCNYSNHQEISPLRAAFTPIRAGTSTIEDFGSDCCFPLTIHYASLIADSPTLQSLALFVSATVDFISIPIRLVTCMPTMLYNSQQIYHPLYSYLLEQGVGPDLLASGCAVVSLVEYSERQTDITWMRYTIAVDEKWKAKRVHFIDMPGFAEEVRNLSKSYYREAPLHEKEALASNGQAVRYRGERK